ncbi:MULTISPECIES: hypothetical protein [Halobacterium]|uniref:DUF7527 domain-containing protein n=1 Tax=Halobacterium TaxID=2239 RepID=UPI00073F2514|nr:MULTISPECIES: hypothetical protein [Halobacterium]MCG1003056.1 hypothetical protein [Halobacterium noricense]
MQAHTVERVESWDSRPFSGGFRELHDLADREFSGAVVADDTWLFMLNGRVVGIFEGDLEDFEDASGTVYEAPHPSLALLFSMQERGGETQAKYYTNDTPLSEAADTLADASFTGYIELSENVLSGDYYVVYYGGRSMNAAFVGASEELVTGDEAFERADDEVGVYEVKKSPVNVTALPEIEDDEEDADAAAGAASPTGAAAAASAGSDEPEADDSEEPVDDSDESVSAEQRNSPASDTAEAAPGPSSSEADEERAEPEQSPTEPTADAETEAADAEASPEPKSGASTRADAARTDEPSGGSATRAKATESDATGDEADAAKPGEEGVFDQEEEWRNARSVPTIDPEKSESTDGGATRSQSSSKTSSAGQQSKSKSTASKRKSTSSSGSSGGKPRSTVDKLKRAVKQRDAKLEEAAERIDDLQAERSDLRERVEVLEAERDDLQAERDDLQARADELEAQLEAAGGEEAASETDLTPAAALSGTNLFVRYDSKGKPTLDDLGPGTDLDAVNQNLRIDHHTQFEAADATVDGEDYESFLEASAAYRFVSWVVRELPFEIRDAGHTDGLADLYRALPDVDRAELDGTVAVDTEDGATSRTFDVVLRDRMGDPLVVAELNAEREPVTGEEMGALVDDATAVREGVDELSAAMYVTSSFFEPAALETASEETGGGGFLSRSDKASFVKVGRKSGYHLCLIEDRNDAFHLTVPEL